MKKEIAKKWVEALRSGEYEQGLGQLRSKDNRYCCLGVLCDLYEKETGQGEWKLYRYTPGSYVFVLSHGFGNGTWLSQEIKEWSGMSSSLGLYRKWWKKKRALSEDNDKFGKSFDEIADIIEKNVKKL